MLCLTIFFMFCLVNYCHVCAVLPLSFLCFGDYLLAVIVLFSLVMDFYVIWIVGFVWGYIYFGVQFPCLFDPNSMLTLNFKIKQWVVYADLLWTLKPPPPPHKIGTCRRMEKAREVCNTWHNTCVPDLVCLWDCRKTDLFGCEIFQVIVKYTSWLLKGLTLIY